VSSRAFPVFLVLACLVAAGCGDDQGGAGGGVDCSENPRACDDFGRCDSFEELRQPFFGDTHVHTSLSLDANLQGTRPGPREAYEFARGASIGLQPYAPDGSPSRTAQIDRPLDFVMLSDHAEYLGAVDACDDPSSAAYESEECVQAREDPAAAFILLNLFTARPQDNVSYPSLCGEADQICIEAGMEVWREVRDAAQAAYDETESCTFTSFVGYEWSAGPGALNLHRNVIFKSAQVPEYPASYFDAPYVEDLWESLRTECIDAGTGCDSFTIPHNSNLAGGTFFFDETRDGSPFDAAYAESRNEMEPIIEIFQHKGASECISSESDELCGFEVLPFSNLAATNLGLFAEPFETDFVRSAYGQGMKLEASLGTNPFQHGIISSTDTHISAPGFVDEASFQGHGGAGQPNRDVFPEGFPDVRYLNPGGLAGVWAEENSRSAIFNALRRKETWGTSGPRIVPRFFGGWDYPADLCSSGQDLAEQGYALGVPMGGELGPRPEGAGAPSFVVHARQDAQGAPLQRIQIIKGSLDGEDYDVQVFEVAGDPNNGASVDLRTCERQGEGFGDLCNVWIDPEFDPTRPAYYYARIIENPVCRWTVQHCVDQGYDCENPVRPIDIACCDPSVGLNVAACDALANGLPTEEERACCRSEQPSSSINVDFCVDLAKSITSGPSECCLPRLQTSIQERAWTSPIWYRPAG
jgi:hypothetical protein